MLFQKIDDKLLKEIYSAGNDVKINENISAHTSAGIGGTVSIFISPYDKSSINETFKLLEAESLETRFMGRGSNIIASDEHMDFAVIDTYNLNKFSISGDRISAECGCSLRKLAFAAAESGLSGLEPLSGIPGSAGGVVRMNAGAYGGETFDFVESVMVYDKSVHETFVMKAGECGAGYRETIFKHNGNLLILETTFKLIRSTRQSVLKGIREYAEKRAEKQPVDRKSAGSVFKKPKPDFHVGKVIEELGMKGMKYGGARISEKHSGFIINTGNSTCRDFMKLIEIITDRVHEKTGVILETEIEFWK